MPFKNVTSLGNDGISNLLELNLKYWLEDAFLRIGGLIPPRTSVLYPDTNDGMVNLMVWNSNVQNNAIPATAYQRYWTYSMYSLT